MSEIAIMLNSSEIPTKRGGFWAKKTISAILKNSVHCGYHRFEKKNIKKAIIQKLLIWIHTTKFKIKLLKGR